MEMLSALVFGYFDNLKHVSLFCQTMRNVLKIICAKRSLFKKPVLLTCEGLVDQYDHRHEHRIRFKQ